MWADAATTAVAAMWADAAKALNASKAKNAENMTIAKNELFFAKAVSFDKFKIPSAGCDKTACEAFCTKPFTGLGANTFFAEKNL